MTLSLRVVVVCIVLALSCANTANAQQSTNTIVTKSEAAERARKAENGRVLKVEQTSNKYRVKVLKKSGRVVTVDVDKRSGKVKTSKDKE
jgi:uncharacterized membrane protein YkoI